MSFFDKLKAKAIEIYYRTGVLPSVSLAQASLESKNGESGLTKSANNLFGKKGAGTAGSVEMRTKEQDKNGKEYTTLANFAVYNSWDESFDDYGDLMGKSSFYTGVRNAEDWKSAVFELDASPYATDVEYGSKIANIIVSNQLYKIDEEVTGKPQDKTAFSSKTPTAKTSPAPGSSIPKLSDGLNGFFNLNPEGWLGNASEWFKSFGFIAVGLVILALGLIVLFGISGSPTVTINKEV